MSHGLVRGHTLSWVEGAIYPHGRTPAWVTEVLLEEASCTPGQQPAHQTDPGFQEARTALSPGVSLQGCHRCCCAEVVSVLPPLGRELASDYAEVTLCEFRAWVIGESCCLVLRRRSLWDPRPRCVEAQATQGGHAQEFQLLPALAAGTCQTGETRSLCRLYSSRPPESGVGGRQPQSQGV